MNDEIMTITRDDLKEFHQKHFGFIPEDESIMKYENLDEKEVSMDDEATLVNEDQMKWFKKRDIVRSENEHKDSRDRPLSEEESPAWLPIKNRLQDQYPVMYGSFADYHLNEDYKTDKNFVELAKAYRVKHYYPVLPINL